MTLERRGPASNRSTIALLAILGVAVFLRLFHLGTESLWLDEGFSVRIARLPLPELLASAAGDIHPPLYYLLLHFWISVFGASEFAARFPSAVFGAASVLLVARLAEKLFDRSTSLVAAALAAVSVFAIHYSQEARSYALLGLLSLASLDEYCSLVPSRGLGPSLRYVLVSVALVYTHNFGWLVLVAQNLHFGWRLVRKDSPHAPRIWHWALLQCAVCLGFAPWAAVFAGQLSHVRGGLWVPRPTLLSLVKTAWEFAGSGPLLAAEGALAALWLFAPDGWAGRTGRILEPGARGAARDVAREAHAAGMPRARSLVALWMAVTVLVPFASSFLIAPVYNTRTMIGAAFGLYLCAADAIMRLPWRRWALVALGVLALLPLPAYYEGAHKEPWREVVAEIELGAAPGDLVVIHAGFNKPNAYDYYARRGDLEVWAFPAGGGEVNERNVAPLEAAAPAHRHVWVVLARDDDPKGLIRATLNRSHRLGLERIYTTRAYEPSRTRMIPSIGVARFDR
jgi:4-amino-4-deoxy-L-arabinose transferase-like glycosyltransferase